MSDHKHSSTGAWALNALEDAERAEVEAYLGENPEAAEEARSLAETATHLAAAAGSETPPPRLKKDIMSAIKQTRQLPPMPTQDDDVDEPEAAEHAAPAAPPAPLEQREIAPEPEAPGADVVSLDAFRRKQQSTRILAAAATVLLLSSGVLTGVVMVQQNELDETKQLLADTARYQEMVGQIMTASDAKMTNAPSSSGGMIHLSYSAEEGVMVLASSNLPELPEGRAYELWLISDDGAAPAGMLSEAEASGAESKILEGPMEGITHIGITVEPATGSEQPTTDPIVLSEL
ncbi:anti-sigma factor domain-containing protein [Zhihengliuella halotolerans]|uniref:anti-sigma factor domain-containing protein n=1 Tax=Zhihengliuella halotolerans TaxID=370736 RepID=UPI000C8054AA|nr:anti-sigma factor [Zhihengliuella halotolerans]